jgi:hypothetical protein
MVTTIFPISPVGADPVVYESDRDTLSVEFFYQLDHIGSVAANRSSFFTRMTSPSSLHSQQNPVLFCR